MRRSVRNLSLLLAPALLLVASCGGGGGGGGGLPPGTTTSGPGTLPDSVGLVSAAAGDGSVHVSWLARNAQGQAVPIAIFRSTNAATVYQGAPVSTNPPGSSLAFTGLPNGQDFFVGLAVDQGGGSFAPAGRVLRVRTGPPVYVDATASSQGADGMTPQTAFPFPLQGVLTAFSNGGGNVWIRGGTYADIALTVLSDVHVYGGFEGTFDPALRDPGTNVTELRGQAGGTVIAISNGGNGVVLDGITVDGMSSAAFGVEADDTDVELRSIVVRGCTSRAVKLRSLSTTSTVDAELVGCLLESNGADGLSVDGAYDVVLDSCAFDANGQEGVDFSDLLGADGVDSSVRIRNCRFFGNALQGLDIDLVPPAAPGASGSDFTIDIRGSLFERNGLEGCLVDIDFELTPGWTADISVRGCTARANRGAGVHIDADSTSTVSVHRLLATDNAGDGLEISSESTPGFASVTSSVFAGNGGAGVHALLGNVPVTVSHSVLAGNVGGGVRSDVLESLAVGCVAYLQPNPFTGTRDHFNIVATDGQSPPFANVPAEYLRATAFDGTNLFVSSVANLFGGEPVEIAGDGVSRTVMAVGTTSVEVAPAPSDVPAPTGLGVFALGASVAENYALPAGSPALGAGMAPPVGAALDAGPLAPLTGGLPGSEGLAPLPLFFAADTLPPRGTVVGLMSPVEVAFVGGTPSGASVSPATIQAVDTNDMPLAITFGVMNGRLFANPPAGGWPTTFTLELHEGLVAVGGAPLAGPVAIPFTAQ